ncbi:MAG TPA: 2-succinyl-6-hydroxy-2,4-cyclohexadiene-1-carboxylate synthase [Bacteroidetes bacterium]|nr:2-succinyl-6-hydroxy-2,4-cyclohexadiene-1-carboxylate synthase [Bacteroidota bacterium]
MLHYKFTGSKNAPVILCLHGFMGSGLDWEFLCGRLEGEFRCLAVDLPGHGKSLFLPEKAYHFNETVRQILSLLDELSIERCHLIGYSMGGRIALSLALNFPGRFDRIVLESASPGLRAADDRRARVMADEKVSRRLETQNLVHFLNNWYRQPLFGSWCKRPEFPRALQIRLKNDPAELAKSLRFSGAGVQPSLWEKLPGNKRPILFLAGEQDLKYRTIGAEMARDNPAVQMKIIQDSAHTIHGENPAAFVSAVRTFLIK